MGPRLRRAILAVLALWIGAATRVAAQVGHPPGGSPYHDIPRGHAISFTGGYLGGEGGRFGIAPHDGNGFGVRYDIRTASAIQVGLGFSRADLKRLVVDPFVQLANRVSGPVDQTVNFVELNLQFNVTGGKTWHRLAPFAGASLGLTFAESTPADTSGFEFGKKIYLAPAAGLRIFITDRLHLRGEARATFWKLKYPTSFEQEPPLEPGTTDHSNAVITDGRVSEWAVTPWLQAGLGYSFSP